MKKIILLLVLLQQIAICQPEVSVFPKVPFTELNALAVDGDNIYTAGDCNTAMLSKDAGETWETFTVDNFVKNIKIVPGSNGEKAFYQFKDGVFVFDSNTLGFEEITSSSLFLSSGNYQSIEVEGQSIYIISNQNIHKAEIGVYDWEKIADFNLQNDGVVASDRTDNYIHVGTLNGVILRVNISTNAVEIMNDFMNRIYSFDMVTDDIGYFSIQNFTYPIKTTDGGANYTMLEEMPENIGVVGYGEDIVMTVNTNRIYVSTDGGQTSTYIPIPDDGTYDLIYTTCMTDDGVLYLAGRSSMIAKTEDFCASFINLNEYKRENLNAINIHSSGTGVAVGGYSSVIKTNDGGLNWELQEFSEIGDNFLNAVTVLSQNKYLVASEDQLLIVENDQVTQTIPISLNNILYNEAGDYLVGLRFDFSEHSIVRSTDGGVTWETKAFIPGHRYFISQAPTGKIYIPGEEGTIYISNDGGDTWDIEKFGDDVEVNRIEFLNENLGIASTGLKLYKTTDGGATSQLLVSGYDIRNLHFITEDDIIYTTSNEAQTNFYESTDGGDSFIATKQFCSQSSSSVIDKDNTIWLAQRGGHINKHKIDISTSTINIENNSLSFYPNPIHKGQLIKIDNKESITTATIMSFSGRTVKLLATHNNTLSTLGLPAGMYTLSVQTNKGETMYGKLVIVE